MRPHSQENRKKNLCDRLARAEGQLRGLQRLVQSDSNAEKVAQQMAAARKALDKAFFAMVADLIATGEVSEADVAALLLRFG
ncbi:MAG: metal-sensing transcriptional repressor [Burkholderiaceae bacterium]|jgi:DNA-binding FrmR family transcriptional regulator|nr:metal-sensing transcriptional repressor [Burkholderiaceae bacterium]